MAAALVVDWAPRKEMNESVSYSASTFRLEIQVLNIDHLLNQNLFSAIYVPIKAYKIMIGLQVPFSWPFFAPGEGWGLYLLAEGADPWVLIPAPPTPSFLFVCLLLFLKDCWDKDKERKSMCLLLAEVTASGEGPGADEPCPEALGHWGHGRKGPLH